MQLAHQEESKLFLRQHDDDDDDDQQAAQQPRRTSIVIKRKRFKQQQETQSSSSSSFEMLELSAKACSSHTKPTAPHHHINQLPLSARLRLVRKKQSNTKMSTSIKPLPLAALLLMGCLMTCGFVVADPSSADDTPIVSSAEIKPHPMALTAATASGADKQNQDSTNVIVIKYANVSTSSASSSSSSRASTTTNTGYLEELSSTNGELVFEYKLNESLSSAVIESRFASNIQLFDVSQNQLSTLPKDLFCPLSNTVRLLNMSHNLLENFDCLGLISQAGQLCLIDLKILDMSHNLIKHLPATGVASLQNLEILNLSNNQIESLDELSLSSLFKLLKLDLSNNKLHQLPPRLFHKSSSMRVLRLQSNYIQTSIGATLLYGLVSLEELDLSYNRVAQVSDSAFLDKVNLTRVDLRHNQLSTLHQEALRVTSVRQATGFRHRLLHNGQYAGVSPKQAHSQSASAEFLLSSNPFVCDCHLEWMRNFQSANSPFRRMLLSSSSAAAIPQASSNRLHMMMASTGADPKQLSGADDSLSAQLMQLSSSNVYQSDQPSVILASSSSDSSNNVSEILSNQQALDLPQHQFNQQPTNNRAIQASSASAPSSNGPHMGPSTTTTTYHYAQIADLDLIKCTPLFKRNTYTRTSSNHHHHGQQHHRAPASRQGAPSDVGHHSHGSHHMNSGHHHGGASGMQVRQQDAGMIDLLEADSTNFLCRYKSHCFALCHCCDFDACDCEMICPIGCNCYYSLDWQANIIDCSSSNHNVVPDRIPMDVSGLYLDGNNIDSLKPSNLIARKSLKALYLNSSNLQNIANRTFNGLTELQMLYLNDNMLRTLNGYEFEPLAQLRALYLQSNRLDHINNHTFIYLRSLEVLDLSNNRLTSVNLELFSSIGHHNIRLHYLSIAHNWWSCQCNAINRFRQILKQKFLLNGSVNIVDKNQLRCYYNSTTVGPLILDSSQQPQLPLYGSFPFDNVHSSSSSIRPQQTMLAEINRCSDSIEESSGQDIDVNPPYIPDIVVDQQQRFQTTINNNEYPNDPVYDPWNPSPGFPANTFSPPSLEQAPNYPSSSGGFGVGRQVNHPPPHLMGAVEGAGAGAGSGAGIGAIGQQQQQPPTQQQQRSVPLSSFVVLCFLLAGIMVIAVSVFVFVRQQQQRYHQSHHHHHHKKSSAASTTSVSSSASSTAISSLNGKSHRHAGAHLHPQHSMTHNGHHHHHHHHQQQHQHQHHLIMSNGSSAIGAASGTLGGAGSSYSQHHQPLLAHHPACHQPTHSNSSQSNIYAALVSPTLGNSTTVNNAHGGGGGGGQNGIINNGSSANGNNIHLNNNLYSNSSTTASHHSGSSHGIYPQNWSKSSSGGAGGVGFSSAPHQQQQQQQLYGLAGAMQQNYSSPFETNQAGGLTTPSQVSCKTTGSLYNAAVTTSPYQQQQQQHEHMMGAGDHGDWVKLPKVKQFMLKLVNKSLALGGIRGSNSRDELSAASSDKIYDAFISYDRRDEAFVMQHLSAELEYGQPQYRIADRYRDLPQPSSAYMAEAITSVIGCSQRTIVVLTESYLASDWCRYELQAALAEASADKSHKIVAVVLDPKCLLDMDPEMRSLLTNSTTPLVGPTQAAATPQLVQLDNQQQQEAQLVTTLTALGASQQVSTQLATSKIAFLNYNERKFWSKLKQLMPLPRPTNQLLTLTTKN